MRTIDARLTGAVCALGSASAFGVTIVVQRSLAEDDLPVTTALGLRFGIAALALFAVLALRRESLLPAPGERRRAALLGIVGYATEAGVFYLALGRGSAGAVALLFYAYPALVVLLEAALRIRALTARTVAAVVLAGLGAVLVVIAGDEVDISGAGVLLALASAVCFSVYLLASNRLIVRSGARVTAAWVAAGASVALLVAGVATVGVSVPSEAVSRIVLNGLATAVAFALLYAALPLLGAGPTAVVMTMEAFVALVLAAAVLDEPIAGMQVLGGIGILAGAALVSTGQSKAPPIP
ncbi:MAG TPA: DMT family transporter [Mycobacteriales bacterium]|nr:DMT family transporter [Mycobacteriales bacterium]